MALMGVVIVCAGVICWALFRSAESITSRLDDLLGALRGIDKELGIFRSSYELNNIPTEEERIAAAVKDAQRHQPKGD